MILLRAGRYGGRARYGGQVREALTSSAADIGMREIGGARASVENWGPELWLQ